MKRRDAIKTAAAALLGAVAAPLVAKAVEPSVVEVGLFPHQVVLLEEAGVRLPFITAEKFTDGTKVNGHELQWIKPRDDRP